MYCSVFSKMASATVVANSPIPQQIHTSKTKLNHHNTASIPHYTQNAKLHAVFTQSFKPARSSDHSQSLGYATGPEEQLPRAGFIQPFGATIVVEDSSFRILAHSENARDMLAIHAPLGADVRSLFTHSSALLLEKAFTCTDTNPILIHSRTSAKPFYGILHRINAGIVIDLEPVRSEDTNTVESKLQSLPGGDVKLLCDTVVESIKEMTGYDRVMVYKFHEDDHGEVVSESKRPDLEAYIGLHYPASDIPEASRVLFKKNRVRMIVDCHASAVRVVQDEALVEPLCLVGSTLRAPHGCHVQYMANMGSIATLVMAVFANGSGTKLWGLVICHHSSPRCIPFPLRRACESLVKDFELRLNTELQTEKRILGELSLRIRESSSASASALCFR